MTIFCREAILKEIIARSEQGFPNEVCGAILRGNHIPLENFAPEDEQHKRFMFDPFAQLAIWTEWDKRGDLTIYHSHPKGSCTPSKEDIDNFIQTITGVSFLIYSVSRGKFRGFRKTGPGVIMDEKIVLI